MKREEKKHLLLVEDDEIFRNSMKNYLAGRYSLAIAVSAEDAVAYLNQSVPDAAVVDITLPNENGIWLLKTIRDRWPQVPVIMLTAMDRIQTVVECIKLGAADYLVKPVITEELLTSLDRAIESNKIKKELNQRRRLQLLENRAHRLLGCSQALEKVRKQIQTVAPTDAPVLIMGETGTGKDLAAREVHALGPRAEGPFVPINCGAIPKDLLETEFFGYKKGAFTGAQSSEAGKYELANGGTLLLDEISELPLDAQAKLLRVLEEHEFYPVGSTELVRVDVRVIACTNRPLDELVKQRLFREDLYFRLNVYTIEIPPLRQRREDIVPLTEYFMQTFNRKFGKNFTEISTEARQALMEHKWKGNVRELRNTMERVILSEEGNSIEKQHLFDVPAFTTFENAEAAFELPEDGLDLEAVEKDLILQALRKANGNKTKAAKLLSLSPPTLYYRLEKYGIT